MSAGETTDDTENVTSENFGSFLPGTLEAFASSPAGFALGLILTPLLKGVETVLIGALDLVTFVFNGACPDVYSTFSTGAQCVDSTSGMIGLADVPLFIGGLLVGIGRVIGGSASEGTGVLGLLSGVTSGLVGLASAAGPAAPIVFALVVVLVLGALAFVVRRVALLVPGIGG